MSDQVAQRTVLVVDDERPARLRLKAMVEALSGYCVVGEAANGEQALDANTSLSPDIVLMDIRMPGMDGLMAARHLAEQSEPPAVIFCTAFDEHALAAFEVHAVGYLLKPVGVDPLLDCLTKAQSVNRSQLAGLSNTHYEQNALPREADDHLGKELRRCISTRTSNGYELLDVESIRLFMADSKYVSAYIENREVLLSQSLKELEQEFSTLFVRVHRNALVAKQYIQGLEKDLSIDGVGAHNGEQRVVKLAGTTVTPVVSRRHLAEIRRLIKIL